MKITHITTVHPRYDTRIFLKECTSLGKKSDYDVHLIVSDGNGNETKNNVTIHDIGKADGRIQRIFQATNLAYKKAKDLNSDIYHLHDPELLPIAIKLKKLGKKVIFDIHEDFPMQLLDKPYLNKTALKVLSKLLSWYEVFACKKFDFIITATPHINHKFLKINKNSININNFPILGELSSQNSWDQKKNEVCYIGGISKIRGIIEIVKSLQYTDGVTLNLGGKINETNTLENLKQLATWQQVQTYGFVDRIQMSEILKKSKAGLVIFHPLSNHINAQPNKMFEYMSAGLPIITSNFPLWKEIVEKNKCGICVDPLDPKKIAEAINYIVTHPKEAEQMGQNGIKAVQETYNWNVEEQKLYKIYEELTK